MEFGQLARLNFLPSAYTRDLPKAEIHVYDTGHFALEEQGGPMTEEILAFLGTWQG